jgi:hypothetical protein
MMIYTATVYAATVEGHWISGGLQRNTPDTRVPDQVRLLVPAVDAVRE